MRRCRLLASAFVALTVSACSAEAAPTPATLGDPPSGPACRPVDAPPHPAISVADPEQASVAVSRAAFPCAETVILADVDDPGATWRAEEIGGPVLLVNGEPGGELTAELDRLGPTRIVLVGDVGPPPATEGSPAVERLAIRRAPASDPSLQPDGGRHVWLVVPGGEALLPAVRAAARAVGDGVLVAGADLRSLDPAARALVAGADSVSLVGDPVPAWQLDVVRAGEELPGGGLLLFPGRRLVALYGHPGAPVLGVLGEHGPTEAVGRAAALAADYDDDGVPTVPAFEIIATVASASAGDDGDYSAEATVDELRPWVQAAASSGVYVILDLQPGRTDFLTQARRYEELLRLPHVGLALDPEWRLRPDQVHLRQIGSVDAAEINEVSRWLAGIVREEALPQKLLLLHQFRLSMITNRDLVETPPELAVVVQMDGQGPLATKHETWRAITAGAAEAGWRWGWKSFYDEDSPMATPAEVLALDPPPVYISFQ